MRINQYISHHTHYSRREADQLILEGKVNINRTKAKITDRVKPHDKVYIGTQFIKEKKQDEYTVIAYYKPKGELVSKKDDRSRSLVYDSLPQRFSHFIPIGRLDFASEGLLLLTDSPKVAQAMMESSLERIYYLKIHGKVDERIKEAMNNGLVLDDARAGGHALSKITSMTFAPFLAYEILKQSDRFTRLRVMINEGKNRELRRFFAAFDREVADLKRVKFGFVSLNQLRPKQWRFLERGEYNKLHEFLKEGKK